MTDRQYLIAYKRRFKRYEKVALPLIYTVLKRQKRAILAYLRKNGSEGFNVAIDTLIKAGDFQRAYERIYGTIGVLEAKEQTEDFTRSLRARQKAFGISFEDEQWRKEMVDYMLLRAGSRIEGITNKTREELRFLLAYCQEQGFTLQQTTDYLIEQINPDDYHWFSKNRAMAIARTESTTAANVGSVLAGESLSIQYEKKWVAGTDNRTRRQPRDKFDHLHMNGVRVGAHQFFTVSGEEMKHPGDPKGSKGNVINCRCICRLVPVYDEVTGLPIPKVPSRSVVFA